MILGFSEDYHKIIVDCKHELALTRSKNDVNAVVNAVGKAPRDLAIVKGTIRCTRSARPRTSPSRNVRNAGVD